MLLETVKTRTKLTQELQREAGCFRNNQHRMNYHDLRTEGYPIGGGRVESAAKQYKSRFSGPGMRWSRAGAARLLPVRTAILSARFDIMWQLSYFSP